MSHFAKMSLGPWWTPPNLQAGFLRVKRNGGGAGGDGILPAQFQVGLSSKLEKLSTALATKSHRIGPCRRYNIAKTSGDTRTISVPCVIDRVWQSALATALAAAFDSEMSEASFAYRPRLSVEDAAARVTVYRLRGYVWVAEADIAKFFDTIPHGPLLQMVHRRTRCEVTSACVASWLQASGSDSKGVLQGSPLSPVLANLYLAPFDEAVHNRPCKLVRYADDFLLMARGRPDAVCGLQKAEQALAALGLNLNPEKTAIHHMNDGFAFLGLNFKGARLEAG
jgi:CRISP-associated protein Cas1